MANSTAIITDLNTIASSAFTAATLTKAAATDKPDMIGMALTAVELASDLKEALQLMVTNTDASDPQLARLNNILGTLA